MILILEAVYLHISGTRHFEVLSLFRIVIVSIEASHVSLAQYLDELRLWILLMSNATPFE